MENLFISPDKDNHVLAWEIFKHQPRPMLENALQEWFEWALRSLVEFQKEMYAAYQKSRTDYLKLERSFTKKVKDLGFDYSGNISKGVTLSAPNKVDWFMFTTLQKKIDQTNSSIEKYEAIKKASQFNVHKLFNDRALYEARLYCGEIEITYQYICFEHDSMGCVCPKVVTSDFKFIFNQDASHFYELGKKIKSVYIRHDLKKGARAFYSELPYCVQMTGKSFKKQNQKQQLPQLF